MDTRLRTVWLAKHTVETTEDDGEVGLSITAPREFRDISLFMSIAEAEELSGYLQEMIAFAKEGANG